VSPGRCDTKTLQIIGDEHFTICSTRGFSRGVPDFLLDIHGQYLNIRVMIMPRVRRGPRPKLRRIPADKASRSVLARFEAELSLSLHPIARRLPAPSKAEVEYFSRRLEAGWTGVVTLVVDAEKELLLGGLEILVAWQRLGKDVALIPQGCVRRIQNDNPVELLVGDHIGPRTDWSKSRRAAAAALFVNEVNSDLPRFHDLASRLNGRAGAAAKILGYYANTSAVLVENAIWAMEERTAIFRRVLFRNDYSSEHHSLPTRIGKLGEAPAHGSRAKQCVPIQIDPRNPEALEETQRAHLAIVDSSAHTDDLWTRLDQTAVVAWFCDLSLEETVVSNFPATVMARLTRPFKSKGQSPPFRFCGACLVPREINPAPPGGFDISWRVVLFFTFAAYNPMEAFPLIPMPELSRPMDKRKCRTLVYTQLLGVFCRQDRNRVFGPYFDTRDENKDEMMILECLKSACSKCEGASLIVYGWI